MKLMKDEKVSDQDIRDNADVIYKAVSDFIRNTGFSAPVGRPKY